MINSLLNKFYPHWISVLQKYNVDTETFICALNTNSGRFEDLLGVSSAKTTKITKEIFVDKPSRFHYRKWLLSKEYLKDCNTCGTIKSFGSFRSNNTKQDGLQSDCIVCHDLKTKASQPQRQSKYRSSILNRTPKWANLDKIKEFYDNCPEGYHVDHVIPLQGKSVSGLHIESNLQYLLAKDNLQKHNKFIAG